VLIGAVSAVGQGLVSRALALLAEAVTLAMDAGLHRRADAYDWFDAVEDQVQCRTLWCIHIWDKQAAAQFGRPPLLRLGDCDVGTPAPVDDEHITPAGVGAQPPGTASRMTAFVCLCHLAAMLDAVLDTRPTRAVRGVHASAARIVAVHLNIATCGLMTYCACKGRATSVRD
jgi:hypothetical protein